MKGLSFSWKRAVGISGLKSKVAQKTGIPTTKQGLERKIGSSILSVLTGSKSKKSFWLLALASVLLISCGGAGKNANVTKQQKPTILILPSDQLLQRFGMLKQQEAVGKTLQVRDYSGYLLADTSSKFIISSLQGTFVEFGYPLNDLEQTLKSINDQEMIDVVDGIKKDAKTILLTNARPDIILEVDYTLQTDRSSRDYKKKLTYTVRAIDAFSNKVVATIQKADFSKDDASDPAALMQAALAQDAKDFTKQINDYFNTIVAEGREITTRIMIAGDAGLSLSDKYTGNNTYTDFIIDWMKVYTKDGAYNMLRNTDTELAFNNVRIKTLNDNGTQYSAYDFARDLSRALNADCRIKSKIVTQGLGDAAIIIQGPGVSMENLSQYEGKIKLTVMVPNDGLKTAEAKQLETKMIQMLTTNGVGGLGGDPRYVIAPEVKVLKMDVTSTAPVRHLIQYDITFYVADILQGTIFASSNMKVTGVGDSEALALIAAFNEIRPDNAAFQKMLKEADEKIINYYKEHGNEFLQQGKMLIAQQKYAEVIALLGGIPAEVNDIYNQAVKMVNDIMPKYLAQECGLVLSQFKAALGNQVTGVNKEAMAYYAMIPAGSPCSAEANELYRAYKNRLTQEDQREWDKQMAQIKADNDYRTLQAELKAKIEISANKCLLDKYKKDAAYNRLPWLRKLLYVGDNDPFDGYAPAEGC